MDAHKQADIDFDETRLVSETAARTIQPDGTNRVKIELPPGCALESADVPVAANSAQVAQHRVAAQVVDGRTLAFQRSFYFGGEGRLVFPASICRTLKTFFDHVRTSDDQTLTHQEAP